MKTQNENPKGSEECDARKPERLQEKQPKCTDEEKPRTVARTKQQEEEEDTGIRPENNVNKEINKATKMDKARKTTSVITAAFAYPPLNSMNKNKAKHYHSL